MDGFLRCVVAVVLAAMLSACSAPPVKTSDSSPRPVTGAQQSVLLAELQDWLPGFYSNYAQVIESGGLEENVTDLTIRRLPAQNEAVYLFETHQREGETTTYDLYFADFDTTSGQPLLHFARMTGSDLSLALADTLDIGWQRVLPECAIALKSEGLKLVGQSDLSTCRFQDPIHGEIAFERSLSISPERIDMAESELSPGETKDTGLKSKHLVQHQSFEGTVSLSHAILPEAQPADGWQNSVKFNLYDDGRAINLYDGGMQQMDYAIRLSKLHWRDNEPPYLRVEIVHLQSGEAQAFSWFDSDSTEISWELDWVKVDLKELDLNAK